MGYKDNPVERIYGEPKPSYMVVRIDGEGKAPKHIHPSRMKAHGESVRLAKKYPGVPFAVVKVKEINIGTVHDENAEKIEELAQEIYAGFTYDQPGIKPEWVPGGNSDMQYLARRQAREKIEAMNAAEPADLETT
jgi:hypothetical protein